MTSKEIETLVREYESKISLYERFANAVKTIVETLLLAKGFKYQTPLFAGAKAPNSLRGKLEDKKVHVKKLNEIQDLARCRVLFYLESDIDRFIREIYEEFEVVKIDDRYSRDDYNAVHLIVRLKDNRAQLPEYAQFAGMVCELQLSTVLYHAWNEISHDILFKPPQGVPQFDERAYEAIKSRLKSVMKKHIREASRDFEFVQNQFLRMQEGKKVFDLTFLSSVDRSNSINDIYQNLKLLSEYVREFGDKTPKELGVFKVIRKALVKSRTLKPEPTRTVLGDLQGYGFRDVANVALEIADTLRYWHTEEVFELLTELSTSEDEIVKQEALRVLRELCKYNLEIIKQAGYAVQDFVTEKVCKFTDEQLMQNLNAVLVIGDTLLGATLEGISLQDEKTLALSSGPLIANEKLIAIREKVLAILKRVFKMSQEVADQKKILEVLEEGTRRPQRGTTAPLDDVIIKTVNDIMEFYLEIIAENSADLIILEEIESQMRQFGWRFGHERVVKFNELETALLANEEYQIFRALVGLDGRWAPDFDFEKDANERAAKVEEFVKNVDEHNFTLWERRILKLLNSKDSADPCQHEYLRNFVKTLSEQKPELMLRFAKEHENELGTIFLATMAGLWASPRKSAIRELILDWIAEGKNLSGCASLFVTIREIDDEIFEKILERAISSGNIEALNSLIRSIAENYPNYKKAVPMFMRIVAELSKYKNFWWIGAVYFQKQSIIDELSEPQLQVILDNLLWLPSIDYHAEKILLPIAKKYPLKIIEWFVKRIALAMKRPETITERYDAIPFHLDLLRIPLSENKTVVIPAIFEWYKKAGGEKHGLYAWEASRLLKLLFPNFDSFLEQRIIEMIDTGDKQAIDVTLNLISNYYGENFLWNVCMAIIRKFSEHEEYNKIKSGLFAYLSQTGVVSGAYRFAEAYKGKLEEIKSWDHENDPTIKRFLVEYADYLERSITAELKRADSEVALLRRQFESGSSAREETGRVESEQ